MPLCALSRILSRMEKRDRRLVVYVEPSMFEALAKLADAEELTISCLVHAWLTERLENEQ